MRRRDLGRPGLRRPDRRPDRQRVRRLRPLRRRRHRRRPARRRLRAGAVRDERPPDLRHVLLRRDPALRRCSAASTRSTSTEASRQRRRARASRSSTSRTSLRSLRARTSTSTRRPNTTFGSLDEYARIVNDDVDQIVTTSWGFCEQGLEQGSPGVQQAENVIFEQAAAQGQTVFSAAGDEGSDDCNAFGTTAPVTPILSVNDPSSQPYVVGCRRHDDRQRRPSLPPSTSGTTEPSGERPAAASPSRGRCRPGSIDSHGAGRARRHDDPGRANTLRGGDLGQPGYAFCLSDNPSGRRAQRACRELPDVSADADEFTGGITDLSPTSSAAGSRSAGPRRRRRCGRRMLADVNASATCKSNPATANGVGFVSPLLYSVAVEPDRVRGVVQRHHRREQRSRSGTRTCSTATTGYDMASGLGTPQLTQPGGKAGLAFYLCSQAPAATRPTVTSISPAVGFTSAPTYERDDHGHATSRTARARVVGVQVGDYRAAGVRLHRHRPDRRSRRDLPGRGRCAPAERRRRTAPGASQVIVTLDGRRDERRRPEQPVHYVDDNGSSQALPTVTRRPQLHGARRRRQHRRRLRRGLHGRDRRHVRRRQRRRSNFTVNADGTQISVKRPGVPERRDGLQPRRLRVRRERERLERHLPDAGRGDDAQGHEQELDDPAALRRRRSRSTTPA